jgi:hypothetical protein
MTTKQYRLIFAENVYERSGTTEAMVFKIGQTIDLAEVNFAALKAGEKLERYTQTGIFTLHKSQFENVVNVTEIKITTSTAKLGNRK